MGILGFLTKRKQESATEQERETLTEVAAESEAAKTTAATKLAETRAITATEAETAEETRRATESISATDQAEASATKQRTAQLSTDALSILESLFAGGAEAAAGSQEAISGLAGLAGERTGAFDPQQFVADTLAAAQSEFTNRAETSVNVLSSAIGGTPRDNSAAALLESKIGRDNAAALAGIRATATGQAEDIARENIGQALGANQLGIDTFLQLGDLLRGAVTTGEGEGLVTQTGEARQTALEAAQQTGVSRQLQTTESSTLDTILEIVSAITRSQQTQETQEKAKGTGTGSQTGSLLDAIGQVVDIGKAAGI